jgi:hypothetical protein
MFKSLSLVPVLAALAVSSAQAEPRIIPGAPLEVKGQGLALLDAVLAHPAELQDVARYGRKVLAVSAQQLTELTRYRVFVGTCTIDPARICIPKAVLEITRGWMIPGRRVDTVDVRELPRPPHAPVPGKLEDATAAVVETLLQLPADVRDLMSHGNSVFAASAQHISPYFSRYSVTVRRCTLGVAARCIGGARLAVQAKTTMDGIVPRTTYETRIDLIR